MPLIIKRRGRQSVCAIISLFLIVFPVSSPDQCLLILVSFLCSYYLYKMGLICMEHCEICNYAWLRMPIICFLATTCNIKGPLKHVGGKRRVCTDSWSRTSIWILNPKSVFSSVCLLGKIRIKQTSSHHSTGHLESFKKNRQWWDLCPGMKVKGTDQALCMYL